MIYLLYLISGIMIIMSLGIFSSFTATKHPSLLLGSMAYGGGGLGAIITGQWWFLLGGFVAAYFIGKLFGDPGQPRE